MLECVERTDPLPEPLLKPRTPVTRSDEMTTNPKATDAYSIASREQALDFMADYPGYGEQRWYTEALGAEQVSFSWRRMPPGTGGRGSYGHRHSGQEEVYFVISGEVTFKVRRRRIRGRPPDGGADRRRRLPLGAQRHRGRGGAVDLLDPAR